MMTRWQDSIIQFGLAVALVVSAGCGSATLDETAPRSNDGTPGGERESSSPDAIEPVVTIEPPTAVADPAEPQPEDGDGYVLHTKGHFTSVVDSNGNYQPGFDANTNGAGVGDFTPPLTAELEKTERSLAIHVRNESGQQIPRLYLLDVHEENGRIVPFGALPANSSDHAETFLPGPKESPDPIEEFRTKVELTISNDLVDAGLDPGIADRMVDTWSKRYFGEPGYRLVYLLPQQWTDRYLPTRISPTPEQSLPVVVGRVELLTPEIEAESVDRVVRAYQNDESLKEIAGNDRLAEPRFRRACQLVDDQTLADWCRSQIRQF